jgi:hypothetical protein
MRRDGVAVAKFFAVVAAFICVATPVNAASKTCTWTGEAGDGLWCSAGNWDVRVPVDGDGVVFKNGKENRIDLAGVEARLLTITIGDEKDLDSRPTHVTLVGGRLAISSAVKLFNNSSLSVQGGAFSVNNTIYVNDNTMMRVGGGGSVDALKIVIGANSVFEMNESKVVGRLCPKANSTVRMTPGSEFKTRGAEPEIVLPVMFDITGGRYVVGRDTLPDTHMRCQTFPGVYGFIDKLDEYVIEYPAGGEMYVKNPGNVNKTDISWTDEAVFRMEGGSVDAPVSSLTVNAVPSAGLARQIMIAPDSAVSLEKSSRANVQFLCRNLVLGAGSVTSLPRFPTLLASYGSSSIDPTAVIRLEVDESELNGKSGTTFPVFFASSADRNLSPTQFAFDSQLGDGSAWRVACVGPYAYLTDGKTPDSTESNTWTGKGGDANWSTSDNWVGDGPGNVPSFAGEKQTYINVDVDTASGKSFRFKPACAAPFIIDSDCGKVVTLNRTAPTLGPTASSIYSGSRYPVVFRLPVTMSADDKADVVFTVCSDGGDSDAGRSFGYVAFMDELRLGKRMFSFCGDVIVGASASVGSILFNSPRLSDVTRATSLHVVDGGSMNVGMQSHDLAVAASMVVEGGGSLVFADGSFTYSEVENQHVVDGLLDIRAPFFGSVDIAFTGTGVVNIARAVAPSSGASVVKLSGGVTLKVSEWETDMITLAIPSGETATLDVEAVATGFSGGLIEVGRDAKLVKAGLGSLKFASPVTVDGVVDVQSGGIAVDGALKEASSNGYVDVLTAADITGTVEVPEGYAFCIVESPEGGKTVRIRRKKGLVFVIK